MAKVEGSLVGEGGAAKCELQTKEADFEMTAEVGRERTGRDDEIVDRIEG